MVALLQHTDSIWHLEFLCVSFQHQPLREWHSTGNTNVKGQDAVNIGQGKLSSSAWRCAWTSPGARADWDILYSALWRIEAKTKEPVQGLEGVSLFKAEKNNNKSFNTTSQSALVEAQKKTKNKKRGKELNIVKQELCL